MLLLQGLIEVWGEGADWKELEASIRAFPKERMEPYLAPDVSFRIVYDDFGVSASNEEQLEAMKHLAFIPWQVCGHCAVHICVAYVRLFRSMMMDALCHAPVSMEEQVSQALADCLEQQAEESLLKGLDARALMSHTRG